MPNNKEGLLDNNTYYPAKNITIFPSSNAVDNGKIVTELNNRNITINITDLNYVVSPNPGGYDIVLNDNNVVIQPGKAIVNGFEILTDKTISYRLPTEDEKYKGEKYKAKYDGFALLCLHTLFDSMENISGNIKVGDTWYCEGITVCYVSAEDYEANENEYLLLGGVTPNGDIKINDEKYTRIDAKYILVRLEPDPETNVPPLQSTDLITFINNFLHGYWVSKAGDNEYGSLIFRETPIDYLKPGFDYKTEKPLSSTDYAVKIDKNSIDSGLSGYINIKNTKDNNQTSIRPLDIQFKNKIEDNNTDCNASVSYKPDNNLISFNITELGDTNNGSFEFKNSNINEEAKFVVHFTNNYTEVSVDDKNGNKQKNYLIDNNGDITTENYDTKSKITVSSKDKKIKFSTTEQEAEISIRQSPISETWKNNLDIGDNVEIKNNLWTHGYIVAGTKQDTENNIVDPSQIEVPDFANTGNYRKLKVGDIYTAGQVWSSVFNDVAEVFDIIDNPSAGTIVSVNSSGVYETANRKKHNNVIGVVAENPAFIMGGKGFTPVAMCGRVKVKYTGKKPKIGSSVGLSKIPGVATLCSNKSKYCIGKITKIYSDDLIEILVK